MPSNVFFRHLAVEGFRGFSERSEFDLNSSVVILTGANGTGKTSFFDALQWLMLGSIARLKSRTVHAKDEFIVGRYSSRATALVEAEMVVGDDILRVSRTGNAASSTLRLAQQGREFSGAEAQFELDHRLAPKAAVNLSSLLLTSGLLQQDEIRRLLDTKPAELYEQFDELLGLQVLEQFETWVHERQKKAASDTQTLRKSVDELRVARSQVEQELARLEGARSDAASMDEAEHGLQAALEQWKHRLATNDHVQSGDGRRLAFAEARRLRRRLEELAREFEHLDLAGAQVVVTQREVELKRLDTEASQASEAESRAAELYQQAQLALTDAERTSQKLAQLSALALDLLTDKCPVCGQRIDRDATASILRQGAQDTQELQRLRQHVETSERNLTAARLRRQATQAALEEIRSRQREAERELTRRDELIQSANALATADRPLFLVPGAKGLDYLVDASYREALADIEAASERLLTVMSTASEAGRISEVQQKLAQTTTVEQAQTERLQSLSLSESRAKTLLDATVKARLGVSSRRVQAIGPLVDDVYRRLDPHPSFKSLDLEHEVFRARGTTIPIATDAIADVTANPSLIFSSSQANIVALAIFLALSLGAGDAALPFILMDDPLQSLDDVNVLGFADLCRTLRTERQVLISTHDRRFASVLTRKLTPRDPVERTTLIRFTGWDRSGPSSEIEQLDAEPEVRVLLSA